MVRFTSPPCPWIQVINWAGQDDVVVKRSSPKAHFRKVFISKLRPSLLKLNNVELLTRSYKGGLLYDGSWHAIRFSQSMDTLFIPKKFEVQFRRTSEDQYTGALVIDGMEMGVGTPKTLDEITAFLMPQNSMIPSRDPFSLESERKAA